MPESQRISLTSYLEGIDHGKKEVMDKYYELLSEFFRAREGLYNIRTDNKDPLPKIQDRIHDLENWMSFIIKKHGYNPEDLEELLDDDSPEEESDETQEPSIWDELLNKSNSNETQHATSEISIINTPENKPSENNGERVFEVSNYSSMQHFLEATKEDK